MKMLTKISKKNINIIRTSSIYLSILTQGLSLSITGPCLLDLQRLVNTDAQHIAFLYTSRSLGFLVGAILGGIVLDLIHSKMLVMTLCNFFVTITLFGIPWSKSVETLIGFAVVNGLSLGAIETGSNVIIIQIWGSGPALQALHFTYGLGSLISPLIAAPFLEDKTNLQNLFNNTNDTSNAYFTINTTANFAEISGHKGIAKLVYPFSIVGIVALLVTVMFIFSWLISPNEDSESQSEEGENANKNCLFMFSTVVFIFLVVFVNDGAEIGFSQTLATYAVKGKVQATAAVASYMTSAFWAAFLTMRMVCVFLSIKFSSMTLLIMDICLIAVAGVMLLFCMPNEGVLWAVAVIFGAGIASMYASLIGWLDTYIKITNKISALLAVGCGAGAMVAPFVITFFMETIPEILAYVVSVYWIISVVLILILYAIIRKHKKECQPPKTECYAIS